MTTIDELCGMLLTNVGKPLRLAARWRQVASWEEAIDGPEAAPWRSIQHELANDIGALVRAASVDEYNRWNTIVLEERERIAPLLRLSETNMAPARLRPVVQQCIRWDLLHWRMAEAYGVASRLPLVGEIVAAYSAGHFPCGLEGSAEDWRMLVYLAGLLFVVPEQDVHQLDDLELLVSGECSDLLERPHDDPRRTMMR